LSLYRIRDHCIAEADIDLKNDPGGDEPGFQLDADPIVFLVFAYLLPAHRFRKKLQSIILSANQTYLPEHLFKVGHAVFAAAMEIQARVGRCNSPPQSGKSIAPLRMNFSLCGERPKRYRYLSKANRVRRS
jgi:hypothetical protein